MLRVSGEAGALRVGYQVAAELEAWTLEQQPSVPRTYWLAARVGILSDYWWAQTPLDLHLVVGADVWTWRQVRPALEGARLTLTLTAAPQVTVGARPTATEEATVWVRSGR